ncbi:MAG: hypothetical protein R6U66_14205 [Bacteroidales bacterium]|jgi:hypothetical protein
MQSICLLPKCSVSAEFYMPGAKALLYRNNVKAIREDPSMPLNDCNYRYGAGILALGEFVPRMS